MKNEKNTRRYYHFTLVYTNENHMIHVVPEIWSVTNRIFFHFGPFLPLTSPLNNPENQNFEKMKEMPGYIIIFQLCTTNDDYDIVGMRSHKIPPFLKIQDVSTFHRFIGKTKVLNNYCNQFVCNFYPQSILVFEECLQKW